MLTLPEPDPDSMFRLARAQMTIATTAAGAGDRVAADKALRAALLAATRYRELASGNPAAAIPAAYSVGRPATRSLALSPWIQRGLLKPSAPLPYPAAIGAAPAGIRALIDQEQQR